MPVFVYLYFLANNSLTTTNKNKKIATDVVTGLRGYLKYSNYEFRKLV